MKVVSSNSFPHYKSICSKCPSFISLTWRLAQLPRLVIDSLLACNSRCINASDESNTEKTSPNHKKVRAKNILDQKHFDKFDPWPILMYLPNAQSCKMEECKRKTSFTCRKCKVYLCVNKDSDKGPSFLVFCEK